MAVNKVVYGATVLVDLTEDTVSASDLAEGITAHSANGELVTGNLKENNLNSDSTTVDKYSTASNNYVKLSGEAKYDTIIRQGTIYSLLAKQSEFGDALASDVAKGKTFTSATGFKVTGTGSEETDPTVPEWAKQPEKPTYTASEVGAEAAGTAESKVSEHNASDRAHNDIRLLVQGLTERLNALADSDDTTLDQMSEIVSYIKYNRSMINGIDTNKVDVSDIVNNLISNNTNKPLSAKQGRVLKSLIDAIIVPDDKSARGR